MLSYILKTASVNVMMNLIILLGKFHIYKSKMNNSKPCLKFFFFFGLIFSFQYILSLKCIDKNVVIQLYLLKNIEAN